MPTAIAAEAINFDELKRALALAPALVTRNVKGELGRFAKRVRKTVIRERLSGRPGIDGGQFTRGKHIQGFATGSDLSTLKAVNKISRILRVHEEGGIITPTHGEWLYLSKKTRVKGKGTIRARVKQVVIPARLQFEVTWKRAVPEGFKKVADGVERAVRQAVDQQMKSLAGVVQRWAA